MQGGLQSGQNIFQVLYNIVEQPVDSLPLTLFKYTQQPDVQRVNESWGVALVLIVIVLITNIGARFWAQRRSSQLKG